MSLASKRFLQDEQVLLLIVNCPHLKSLSIPEKLMRVAIILMYFPIIDNKKAKLIMGQIDRLVFC